jgi:hypothetical protein
MISRGDKKPKVASQPLGTLGGDAGSSPHAADAMADKSAGLIEPPKIFLVAILKYLYKAIQSGT